MTEDPLDAWQLAESTVSASLHEPSALELANLIGLPLIRLGGKQNLQRASTAAMRLFRVGGPLKLIERSVVPAREEDLGAFQAGLHDAMANSPGRPVPWRMGTNGRLPDLFGTLQWHGQGWSIVAIEPGRGWSPVDGQFFRHWFGLTARETQVAEQLAIGATMEAAAAALQISTGTARTHVKNIFTKLGLSRHAELIYLLAFLRVPPMPDNPPAPVPVNAQDRATTAARRRNQ